MSHSEILVHFARIIKAETGIVFGETNYFQLETRLEQIAKSFGLGSIVELTSLEHSALASQFRQLLIDSATNNETSFFRDIKVYNAIESGVIERFAQRVKPLRIWSCASSSGQEALSIAILLSELREQKKLNFQFEILATDISDRVLAKARSGRYTQLEIQRGLPTKLLLKYFDKLENDIWQAKSSLLGRIEHKKQNLIEPFAIKGEFEIILCRNVLIYQSVPGKVDIIQRLETTLSDDGILVLGSGESLLGLSSAFDLINSAGAVLYSKKGWRKNVS